MSLSVHRHLQDKTKQRESSILKILQEHKETLDANNNHKEGINQTKYIGCASD